MRPLHNNDPVVLLRILRRHRRCTEKMPTNSSAGREPHQTFDLQQITHSLVSDHRSYPFTGIKNVEFRTGWNSLTKGCGRRGWWGEYRPTDADDTSFGHTSKASLEIPRAWAPPIQSMLGDFQRENSGMGAIANKSEAGGGGGDVISAVILN